MNYRVIRFIYLYFVFNAVQNRRNMSKLNKKMVFFDISSNHTVNVLLSGITINILNTGMAIYETSVRRTVMKMHCAVNFNEDTIIYNIYYVLFTKVSI